MKKLSPVHYIVGSFILLFVIVSATIMLENHLTLPGDLASIEQLKADLFKVDKLQSPEVIADVTTWNQTIASNKQYRELWWGRIYVPAEWETVQLIEIP